MAVYIVTWDLNKEGSAYNHARSKLLSAINTMENTYSTSLDSVRFVSTSRTANQLWTYLRQNGGLDTNDTVVVVRMFNKGDNASNDGNLGETFWNWINARI